MPRSHWCRPLSKPHGPYLCQPRLETLTLFTRSLLQTRVKAGIGLSNIWLESSSPRYIGRPPCRQAEPDCRSLLALLPALDSPLSSLLVQGVTMRAVTPIGDDEVVLRQILRSREFDEMKQPGERRG